MEAPVVEGKSNVGPVDLSYAPPFPAEQSLIIESEGQPQLESIEATPSQNNHLNLVWPVFYARRRSEVPHFLDTSLPGEIAAFTKEDVSLERLNRIRRFLWFAGNVGGRASCLTEFLEYNRSIKLTNRADMHVVTHSGIVYLKPLPDYLLCHRVWADYICRDLETFQDANVLICSYMYVLILSKSDLRVAQSHGLVNEHISWEQWTSVAREVSRHRSSRVLNLRWIYGELRLARLNWIYRFTHLDIYHRQDSRGWLIGTLLYITIVLTAMQVGLGTDKLQNSLTFQRASYGFTVFSIMAPVIILFSRWGALVLLALKKRASSKIASDRFEKTIREQVTTLTF